jgi:hypothetical protein
MSEAANSCFYCVGQSEPGWIETDNNGPIVRCAMCNRDESDDYQRALDQQAKQKEPRQ